MCAFIRLATPRLIHTLHHHVRDETERAETNYLLLSGFQISRRYVESRSCLCVSLCSSVAVLMYRVGAAARSWLFKINTRITPPHFFLSPIQNTDLWQMVVNYSCQVFWDEHGHV